MSNTTKTKIQTSKYYKEGKNGVREIVVKVEHQTTSYVEVERCVSRSLKIVKLLLLRSDIILYPRFESSSDYSLAHHHAHWHTFEAFDKPWIL